MGLRPARAAGVPHGPAGTECARARLPGELNDSARPVEVHRSPRTDAATHVCAHATSCSDGGQNKGPDTGPPCLGQKGIAPITVTCIDPLLTRKSGSAAVGTGYADFD